MPMRNPFRKADPQPDDLRRAAQPGSGDSGFYKTDLVGSRPSAPMNIGSSSCSSEPPEYKLCEINDSGVFLPPSPPERQSVWQTRTSSSTSTNYRSIFSENEPFNMSRESFDSYRRSFDISARSPVLDSERRPRQSLDAQKLRLPSAAIAEQQQQQQRPPPLDEDFEDVGLHDEVKPKKRSIFSRFGDSDSKDNTSPADGKQAGHHTSHFFGRRRGHSGQGAELGSMKRPGSSHAAEVKVDS